ncbi:MAG: MlaD family protein [Candidatus Cloacimonetes bacterium]|nr:MlaD family protein [Candidatus Cloacimonadota bacterium]
MKFYEKQSRTNFNVGLFVIVSITILVFGYLWLINYLERGRMTSMTIAFPEVGSLELGDGVLILGVNRGKVSDIRLDIDRVLVDIAVKLDEPLRQGSEFWVKNTSVMGSTRIILVPGKGKSFLPVDKILEGKTASGFSSVLSEAEDIMTELKIFLKELNSSDNIVSKYSRLADSLQLGVKNVNELLERNDGNIDELIVNLEKITAGILLLLENNSARIDSTITGTEQLVTDLNKTNISLQQLVEKLQNEHSTLGELTGNDELYRSLLQSVAGLDSLLADIKNNPKKYFSVKVF